MRVISLAMLGYYGLARDFALLRGARTNQKMESKGMSWHVYIVRCGDGSLYTGIAIDPYERVKQHNVGKGSKYVRRKGLAKLVHAEPHLSESGARRREIEIKSWNRKAKLALIAESSFLNGG